MPAGTFDLSPNLFQPLVRLLSGRPVAIDYGFSGVALGKIVRTIVSSSASYWS
jgi:hypothetical protein